MEDRYEQDRKWFWEEQRKIEERSRKEQFEKQKQQTTEVKVVKKQK